jgi:hypothetical protein
MTPDDLEKELHASIRFALSQYGYKPPRTRDTDATDAYYTSVASAIVRQIKLSGWDLIPGQKLERQPPRQVHSFPPYKTKSY